jgi:enamine deaminase RidA (YjgF/YER057c/UK114 family)
VPSDRQLISANSPYESTLSFSRAVRVGRIIAVAGTAPIGEISSDPSAQARRCLEIIREALERAGARLDDVIRTRIFLTRIEDWEAVGRLHGEFFGDIRPALTVMQVAGFIDPAWLVEIEADAVIVGQD